jgi:hypothetical protein
MNALGPSFADRKTEGKKEAEAKKKGDVEKGKKNQLRKRFGKNKGNSGRKGIDGESRRAEEADE